MFFFLIFLWVAFLASVFVCLIVFALYFFLSRKQFWLIKGKLLQTYQLQHIINFEFNTELLFFLKLSTCVALANAIHDAIFVLLQRNNLPAVRQYLETFAINIYLKFPYLVRLSFSALLSCHFFFVSCLYSFAVSLVIGIKIGVMPRREILLKVRIKKYSQYIHSN